MQSKAVTWVSTAEELPKSFVEKLGNFLDSLGWSEHQLCIKAQLLQGRKCIHYHHRKKIFCKTFLASKRLPRPVAIENPLKNQGEHIYHRNLSSVSPISFDKEKFLTGAGWCMVSKHAAVILTTDFNA